MEKKRERAIGLLERIVALRQELRTAEAELDEILPSDNEPTMGRRAAATAVGASKGNGSDGDLSKRGGLTDAIRKLLQTATRDLTTGEMIRATGAADRKNSVYAAVSRMLQVGEIEKGATEGTYRLARKH